MAPLHIRTHVSDKHYTALDARQRQRWTTHIAHFLIIQSVCFHPVRERMRATTMAEVVRISEMMPGTSWKVLGGELASTAGEGGVHGAERRRDRTHPDDGPFDFECGIGAGTLKFDHSVGFVRTVCATKLVAHQGYV